jgi:uroporphyrinogen-III decarboxylase
MMDAIERTRRTMASGKPDRLPVDLHNFQPAAAALGQPSDEVFKSGEMRAESQIRAWREFGHDVIILESGTSSSAEACDVTVICRDDAAPVATRPALSKLEDVACKEAIEIMRGDAPYHTGFILGPGCALAPETPADNIHALVEAAKRYGVNR